MKKNIFRYSLFALLAISPTVTFAALDGTRSFLTAFTGLLNSILKVIFGLAVIFFFWGTTQFILHAGEQKTRDEGKQKMLWGIIALFVMVSIYGIINWIGGTLGIPTDGRTPGTQTISV